MLQQVGQPMADKSHTKKCIEFENKWSAIQLFQSSRHVSWDPNMDLTLTILT